MARFAAIDLIGHRYGPLTVLARVGMTAHGAIWECVCDCGASVQRATGALRRKSCAGCGDCAEKVAAAARQARVTHGQTRGGHSRLYKVWANMRQRCVNPAHPRWSDYGGRGVRLCDDWRRFEGFAAWATANGYTDDMTIDRIETDGGYDPANCCFVPLARNIARRNTRTGALNRLARFNTEVAFYAR